MQVVTTMDFIALDPVTLAPLRRFGYRDLCPTFKVLPCSASPVRFHL